MLHFFKQMDILAIIENIKHIGHVDKMSVSGYISRRFKPRLHQYVVSLSKTLYLHCFS